MTVPLKTPIDHAVGNPTILQRVAAGEMSAVEECLALYGNLVWRIASKSINSREDVEDAVQEIFISIWQNAAKFDPSKSPEGAFIYLVAKRRLVDRLRKIYRRRAEIPISESVSGDLSSNVHVQLNRRIEAKPVVEALNSLSPSENMLIRMSIYAGNSHGEIAEKTKLPLGTVKTKIRRGLDKLRRSIGSLQEA